MKIIVILLAIVFLMAPQPARAIEENHQDPVSSCAEVQAKIEEKTQHFTEKRQQHIDGYGQISALFTSVVGTLEGADYNAGILKELEVGLDRRIVSFASLSEVFLNEMEDAGESACRDKASFYQEIDEARLALKDVQLSVADMQKYIQETLVTSITAVVKESN